MAENSAIEWTDHTLIGGVDSLMAAFAQRDAITQIKPKIWMRRERFDVVGVQVPAARVAAVLAGEAISAHYIKAPSSTDGGLTQVFPFLRLAVDVAVTGRPAWRAFTGAFADKCARFRRVFHARSVAPALPSFAHFAARRLAVLLPFERRNERFAALDPSFPHDLTAGQRSVCHG